MTLGVALNQGKMPISIFFLNSFLGGGVGRKDSQCTKCLVQYFTERRCKEQVGGRSICARLTMAKV